MKRFNVLFLLSSLTLTATYAQEEVVYTTEQRTTAGQGAQKAMNDLKDYNAKYGNPGRVTYSTDKNSDYAKLKESLESGSKTKLEETEAELNALISEQDTKKPGLLKGGYISENDDGTLKVTAEAGSKEYKEALKLVEAYNADQNKVNDLKNKLGSKVVLLGRADLQEKGNAHQKTYDKANAQFDSELKNMSVKYQGLYTTLCHKYAACKKATAKASEANTSPQVCNYTDPGNPENKLKINYEAAKSSEHKFPQEKSDTEKIGDEFQTKSGDFADLDIVAFDDFGEVDQNLLEKAESKSTNNMCDQWAIKQTSMNGDIVAARTAIIDEDNRIQMVFGTGGVMPEESPKMKKFIAETAADSGFPISFCKDEVYNDLKATDFQTIGEVGVLIKLDSDASMTFSVKDNRRVKKPWTCEDEERDHFKNEDDDFYTNFSVPTLERMTNKARKRVCVGMAYMEDENGIACNDFVRNIPFCYAENSELVSANASTAFEFGQTQIYKIEDSFFEFTQEGLAFPTDVSCGDYMLNKFKQCMGMNYKEISFAAPADPSVSGLEPTEADASAVADLSDRAKERHTVELSTQYGVCIAFRDLAKEQTRELDKFRKDDKVASMDGRFVCSRVSPWTQDFKACKNLVNVYNGFAVGDLARNVGGQGWSMVRQKQIRDDATDNMLVDNGKLQPGDEGYVDPRENQVNVALDSQKKMYDHQKEKEYANLGFFSAESGTLTTLLAVYPTPKSFGETCDKDDGRGSKCIADGAAAGDEDLQYSLFANQHVRKQMWGKVMESASSAALAALKASQYKKMANDVQTYKNAFNDLNKDATNSSSTLEVGYCSLNPTAPGCTNTGPRVMGNSQFSYGSIGAQNGSGGAIDFNNDEGNLGAFDEEQLTQSQQTAIDDLGSVIDQDSAGSFGSGIEKKVGAGKFSRSPASGGGGGGGGGAGGGGGSAYNGGGAGGGAGGNNSAFGGPKQKVSFGAAGGKVKYSGSGSGSSKKSSNPFSSLFGKKKGRNVASKVTNDIAPSHSGLFDKISKRYTKMQQADRLHKLK